MNTERERLETLWAGPFGDAYVDRNMEAHAGRLDFWRELTVRHEVESALEIGCNAGGNMLPLSELLGTDNVAGVDVNDKALAILRERVPGIDARRAVGSDVPVEDRSFDLTFTMGVLIHQPDESLRDVMASVVRCSSRLVFCCEYFSEQPVEVPYRGESGALFKRDYGALYEEWFPELARIDHGFLGRDQGYDDATWWLFRRPA